jgi:uncharacterized protein YbaR (Trm112 family)
MKYRLMDLLACPICKHFPLELHVFKKEAVNRAGISKKCEEYCGYEGKPVRELEFQKCGECSKIEIVDGLLFCPSCKRWYPIEEEIPRMLPDELRKREEDIGFLKKFENLVPKEVLKEGKPFNLRI